MEPGRYRSRCRKYFKDGGIEPDRYRSRYHTDVARFDLAEDGKENSVLSGSLSPDTQIVIISRLFKRPVRRMPLEYQFIIAFRQNPGRQPQINGSA